MRFSFGSDQVWKGYGRQRPYGTLYPGQALGPDPLASGEAVGQRLRDCFLYDRMAQRPAVLENLIFV